MASKGESRPIYRGDTLYQIARHANINLPTIQSALQKDNIHATMEDAARALTLAIAQANHVENANNIQAGKTLILPTETEALELIGKLNPTIVANGISNAEMRMPVGHLFVPLMPERSAAAIRH